MTETDEQTRRTRRRAGLGLLITAAVLGGAACSAATTDVATGDDDAGTTVETVDNETDAAALASALGGIETSTTAGEDGPGEGASGAENCAQFTYQDDAQAVLEADLSDPYNLDEDGNAVACDGLPSKPVQSLPPQTTSPPQTQPPQTQPPRTVTTVAPQQVVQPQAITPSAQEQSIVDYVGGTIGHPLSPEATLFNAARTGGTTPPGPVVFPYYAHASATGGGSVDSLKPLLAGQLGNFGPCTHIGVGILPDPAGTKVLVLCGKF